MVIGYIIGSVKHYTSTTKNDIACRKGCNHCCKYMVAVSPAEAVAIFQYLQRTRSKDKLDKLKLVIDCRVQQIQGMNEKEYWEATNEIGCLFLNQEGACTIYPIRPRACASLIVADVEPCKEHKGMIQMHVVPKTMGILGYIALSKELRRRKLQSGIYEFNSALHTLFQDKTAVDRWLKGEEVFHGNMNPNLDNHIHLEVTQ